MFTCIMGFLQEMDFTPVCEASMDFVGSATAMVCVDVQEHSSNELSSG